MAARSTHPRAGIALLAALVAALCAAPAAAQVPDAASTVDVPIAVDAASTVDVPIAVDAAVAVNAAVVVDAAVAVDAAVVVDVLAVDASVAVEVPSEPPPASPTIAAPPPVPPPPSAGAIARVTVGLMLLLGLALLGGHPSVRAWEKRSGLAMVTGSGLPFLVLGLVARRPEVGILTPAVLHDLRPLLEFGLGWIGFRVGTDFDLRHVERWPRNTLRAMAIESACTMLVVGVLSAAVLTLLSPHAPDAAARVVRNAVIIGACAAVSAPTGARLLGLLGLIDAASSRQLRRVASLDDVMALLALALVTAAFRPVDPGAWHLPPLGWVFLQVGLGVALGLLVWVAVRNARNATEDVAMTLGALAFAAGMSGYVGLSPLAVCFVSGMTAANMPGAAAANSWLSRPRFRALERPIYMAFFVVVGALWSPDDRRGWIMLPLYVVARLLGKLLGVRAARAALIGDAPDGVRLGSAATTWLAFVPSSAVSIAVVVSARQSYPELLRGTLETVVIGGALLSELVFRVAAYSLAGRGAAHPPGSVGALSIDHDDPDDERPDTSTSIPPGEGKAP